jgi:hypothetical protein
MRVNEEASRCSRQRGRMKDDKTHRPEYFILPREANKVSPGVYMRVNEEASRCARQSGRMKDEGYIKEKRIWMWFRYIIPCIINFFKI